MGGLLTDPDVMPVLDQQSLGLGWRCLMCIDWIEFHFKVTVYFNFLELWYIKQVISGNFDYSVDFRNQSFNYFSVWVTE